MIRLKSLYIKDFRSIDGELNVSLDAPIVLIHGPNGAGKTSLLSAIELALSGTVPSLSRAEPEYLAYLPHRGRASGEVKLEVAEIDGSLRIGEIRVTPGGISGTSALSGSEALFFSERSYLAQSTLGRLLEIYQHAERKVDSPLTRFVKELLGLDRMEALISGLHTSGNITRLKGPVPGYASVRDEILAKEALIADLGRKQSATEEHITALEQQIRLDLLSLDPSLLETPASLPELARLISEKPEDIDLRALIVGRREAEVAQTSLAKALATPGSAERTSIETSNHSARIALDTWSRAYTANVDALLERAAAFFADVSVSSETGYHERAFILGKRLQDDLQRVQILLDKHELALTHRDALTRQLDEARVRLGRLSEQIAGVAVSNESVARTLSDIIHHIHGESCPVCDRDFSEVSASPLAAYVAGKVSAMIEQAGRLQSLAGDQTRTSGAIAQLERQLAATVAALLSESELTKLKARAADLTETTRQLGTIEPVMREGDRLRAEATRVARSTLLLQNADQSIVVLRNSIKDLAQRFGVQPEDEPETGALLQLVEVEIRRRENALNARLEARRQAAETVGRLIAVGCERDELDEQQRAACKQLSSLRRRKSEADKLIEVAKEVVRQTREARGRVVRKVFNDELNAIWRNLFVRLAPDEPYIPAFAIPETTSADIEAVLETHHRRGGKGGNPRAMLSAGNLNTAALTLFLALNLSVEAKLPWLVIDDPVQSMDEVHIAQFAALLRTLSKQMQRQVIVAVHERSLFDYLALELSPAFEGDRLNVIELGRSATGKTLCRWDAKLFTEDKAIAA